MTKLERKRNWIGGTLLALIILLLGGLMVQNWVLAGQKDTAATNAQDYAAYADQQCQAGKPVIWQGKNLCPAAAEVKDNPVATPSSLPVVTTTPQVVIQKASADQFAAEFKAYCAQKNACAGANGRAPTAAELSAALKGFCSTRNDCTGASVNPAMVLASVATVCATGMCTGEDGKSVTAEQLSAEVAKQLAVICANDACKGPMGPEGKSVPQTITGSWSCNAEGYSVFTLNGVDYPSPNKCDLSTAPPTTPPATETPTPTGGS